MASNSSGQLKEKETYTLGKYVFSIVVTRLSDEKVTAVTANVVCEGKRAVKGEEFSQDTQIRSWHVEANEDTADVYVTIEIADKINRGWSKNGYTVEVKGCTRAFDVIFHRDQYYPNAALVSTKRETVTVNGKSITLSNYKDGLYYANITLGSYDRTGTADWLAGTAPEVLYAYKGGGSTSLVRDVLLGRFEIDLETAGGGPDGDWDEPGDDGDPSYTLNLTVTGASAGAHSASSFPSDNETVKDYGCGGDGGHGGGGGAGASTVIIYEFVTSQAGSVNQEAYTREPGVGSGGGKGGKGGDGCILIYY